MNAAGIVCVIPTELRSSCLSTDPRRALKAVRSETRGQGATWSWAPAARDRSRPRRPCRAAAAAGLDVALATSLSRGKPWRTARPAPWSARMAQRYRALACGSRWATPARSSSEWTRGQRRPALPHEHLTRGANEPLIEEALRVIGPPSERAPCRSSTALGDSRDDLWSAKM